MQRERERERIPLPQTTGGSDDIGEAANDDSEVANRRLWRRCMDRLRKGIFYIFKFDFQSSLKRRGWGGRGVDFYSKWHVYI